jgi:hypothetical protein
MSRKRLENTVTTSIRVFTKTNEAVMRFLSKQEDGDWYKAQQELKSYLDNQASLMLKVVLIANT